ncbi:hypothetical protein RIR_jg40132.t1 [Rhizophagus irregularis DAOM 181602=DAOM 197198]|uniref:RNase H type-1 domain-containing protein n=1 Tax=Rhizophagus irregularis (strain DAOM 181602 / DAOM 197198 / MUCL 43194) TaxID=747089 RepID=U9TKE9_RHIID|nr:hypothetical protein RIR_jg40132.t1 [Rhizophagus irregularis DAOM 181602=DAOM 197198]
MSIEPPLMINLQLQRPPASYSTIKDNRIWIGSCSERIKDIIYLIWQIHPISPLTVRHARLFPSSTNVEALAICTALATCPRNSSVNIYTDFQLKLEDLLHKVKAHSGASLNDEADAQAKLGLTSQYSINTNPTSSIGP